MLTQEIVKNLFDYKNGNLVWKVNPAKNVKSNTIAGYKGKDNYIRVVIQKKIYFAHRVIFLLHHGYLPRSIDHIDRNRSNNTIENLRETTYSQNVGNQKLHSRNRSGYRGVSFNKKTNKWRAMIGVHGKVIYLGSFLSAESAYAVYCDAAKIHFGEFANI